MDLFENILGLYHFVKSYLFLLLFQFLTYLYKSDIDTSKGDVNININVIDSSDSTMFANTCLVTDGYVDEKMAWILVDDKN